jgi:hypothetical protein
MLTWLVRLLPLAAFGARAYAREVVREYIRELVRVRLRAGLSITASQLVLLAITAFSVHRLGDPLAGRLVGSALVWLLIAFNATRFLTSTVPDIAQARRRIAGPWGHVIRGLLGISIAKELVEMELVILALCLILGLYVRFGVSSIFHLLEPWRQLVALNGW